MLLVEANERTKECCLLLLLLLQFWLYMNFGVSKPFKFPIHQTKKIQFYLINFTILMRIFIESPTLLCEIDTFFRSCCCWFLVCESFIRFAFMSPDVWFRLRSAEFLNWNCRFFSLCWNWWLECRWNISYWFIIHFDPHKPIVLWTWREKKTLKRIRR